MTSNPKITFIGAGSTVFMKNIIGDVLQRDELSCAHVSLMDINSTRLQQSEEVCKRMISTLGVGATLSAHTNQKEALEGANFVVVAFQVGGYDPCTINDFEIPKKYGLRQTIADTLGIGGIMRGVRTVPHLWSICEDMMETCPDATLLQYVNPMAINTWAITKNFPKIKQVGLCHSVQHTAKALSVDLGVPLDKISYKSAGINHIAFFLEFKEILENGKYRDLYPALQQGYAEGRFPTLESRNMPRCENKVRYEMLKRLGYFVTESSEHFAEYVPWFIKEGREDILNKFEIPLDEYPKRCVEQIADWEKEYADLKGDAPLILEKSDEYATQIMASIWTGSPSVIYGNIRNDNLITNLPNGCAVEVPCLIDRNGIQPTHVGHIPSQLAAVMQSNVTVQGLVVDALMEENPEHIYHAAMMDPHTAAELDLDQIWSMTSDLLDAHRDWLPQWAVRKDAAKVA